MSSANKKHMQGGMNTTYSNVNTEDERNKKRKNYCSKHGKQPDIMDSRMKIIILEQPRKQGIWKIC